MGILQKLKKPKTKTTDGASTAPVSETHQSKTASAGKDTNAVLVHPLVSEKASHDESHNTYTFVVNSRSTKIDIKRAIKEVYGVMPTAVRVLNVDGKVVAGRHGISRRKNWKKARVTLPKGTSIQIHEGV